MENKCFELIEKISEGESKEILFNYDDISAIEKSFIIQEEKEVHVLAMYTRNPILMKKSQCMVLSFPSKEARDQSYNEIRSRMNPMTFEVSWFPL